MTMGPANRTRWLLAVLPAVVTAVAYSWTYGRSAQERFNCGCMDQIEAEHARPAPQTLASARRAAEDLARQAEELGGRARRQASSAALSASEPAACPAVHMHALSKLMRTNRLVLVETKRAGACAGERKESCVADGLRKLAEQRPGTPPELWTVEVVGTYAQVVSALRDLNGSREPIVPAGVSMQPLSGALRKWSLWFWI